MIRYLTLSEVTDLHRQVIEQSGGSLGLRDLEIDASVDDQEQIILSLASGELQRDAFTDWLKDHPKPI